MPEAWNETRSPPVNSASGPVRPNGVIDTINMPELSERILSITPWVTDAPEGVLSTITRSAALRNFSNSTRFSVRRLPSLTASHTLPSSALRDSRLTFAPASTNVCPHTAPARPRPISTTRKPARRSNDVAFFDCSGDCSGLMLIPRYCEFDLYLPEARGCYNVAGSIARAT